MVPVHPAWSGRRACSRTRLPRRSDRLKAEHGGRRERNEPASTHNVSPSSEVRRRRSDDSADAGGAHRRARDVARARAALPRAHRDVRAHAERGDHGEPDGARRGRRARSRARGGTRARPAARHSRRAQGQHPHDEHADDRRRARLQGASCRRTRRRSRRT